MVVNGSSSDALPLLSRVPVIGPLLFLFYIDFKPPDPTLPPIIEGSYQQSSKYYYDAVQ